MTDDTINRADALRVVQDARERGIVDLREVIAEIRTLPAAPVDEYAALLESEEAKAATGRCPNCTAMLRSPHCCACEGCDGCRERATPSPSLAEAAEDGEAFPWGTVAIINGEQYWLNQCLKCAPTGQPTYHVIKGEPQPSLNDMMNEDE